MILAIAIQCRDRNTRLKHKSVRPFYKGKSILQIIIERFKIIGRKNIFVLTTKTSPKTIEQAKAMGVKVFIGDEDDVHSRFCNFVTRYQPEGILRICADNPMVALGLSYPVEKWGVSKVYDYVSFEGAMQRHEGLFCEYVSESALMELKNKKLSKSDKEHVTKYIYEHPDEFNILSLPVPSIMNDLPIRLSVDTISDFKVAQKVYRVVGERYWMGIYEYLYNKPELLNIMKKNIEENQK